MTREQLLSDLRLLSRYADEAENRGSYRQSAEERLLQYLNDADIEAAYRAVVWGNP